MERKISFKSVMSTLAIVVTIHFGVGADRDFAQLLRYVERLLAGQEVLIDNSTKIAQAPRYVPAPPQAAPAVAPEVHSLPSARDQAEPYAAAERFTLPALPDVRNVSVYTDAGAQYVSSSAAAYVARLPRNRAERVRMVRAIEHRLASALTWHEQEFARQATAPAEIQRRAANLSTYSAEILLLTQILEFEGQGQDVSPLAAEARRALGL